MVSKLPKVIIKNRLHHVKDAIMHEDRSGIRNADAAAGMSVFRNVAINIVRGNGSDSVKAASIFLPPTPENDSI